MLELCCAVRTGVLHNAFPSVIDALVVASRLRKGTHLQDSMDYERKGDGEENAKRYYWLQHCAQRLAP